MGSDTLLLGFAELLDTDDGQPFQTRNAENHIPKRAPAFIHTGTTYFRTQKKKEWVNSRPNAVIHTPSLHSTPGTSHPIQGCKVSAEDLLAQFLGLPAALPRANVGRLLQDSGEIAR